MEGNELNDPNLKCVKCKQTCEEEFYNCDSCLQRIHKKCSYITSSEVKCMPLQKRVLLLICEECKLFIARMPYMMKLIEEMKKDIEILKTANQNTTYASTLQGNINPKEDVIKKNPPTIIIKPKVPQDSGKSRKEIQASVNPTSLNVGIIGIRETKKGSVVVKCETEQEMTRLKKDVENRLKGKYEIELPKKTLPKIKISGYTGNKSANKLEETIRKQNNWIKPNDHLKVTFVRQHTNNSTSTIYAECSGSLCIKMINYKKLYIDWERLPVYEDLTLSRCYKCQGFHHKSNKCMKNQICGNCAGDHNTFGCKIENKKCINCVTANKQYKMQYGTNHTALDLNCPSLKYHMEVMKGRIDYSY